MINEYFLFITLCLLILYLILVDIVPFLSIKNKNKKRIQL